MIKTCIWCNKEFETSDNRKVCSPECKVERTRYVARACARRKRQTEKTKTCDFCGKEFITKGNKIYCSVECRESQRKKLKVGHVSKKPVVTIAKANMNARNKGQSYGQYVAAFYTIGQETIEQKLKRRRFHKLVEAHERACD